MIRKAVASDASLLAKLAMALWEGHAEPELTKEMEALLCSGQCALFLALEAGQGVGFAQCQLRQDYVEGTQSSPVGYLEGIYVSEAYSGRGIARALVTACEQWAKEMGCREFASDCELTNTASLAFHLHLGFREANRIICFTKTL